MDKIVQLHGGPWHGKRVSIPVDRDHLHLQGIYEPKPNDDPDAEVQRREGIYSQITGYTNDFEWDGYITHE